MSEQRIDTGAEAATSTDADPGEGQGLSDHGDPLNPAGSAGSDADMPQPTADRTGGGTADTADTAETEGLSHLRDTEAKQGGSPDLSGRNPSGATGQAGGTSDGEGMGGMGGTGSGDVSGSASGGSSGGGSGSGSGDGSVGEVSQAPREERRKADPGSTGREFGDRADEAPDDPIAHPSI